MNNPVKIQLRQRELPAHVVVYYVMGLALYMQVSSREVLRCMLEGAQWVLGPAGAARRASCGTRAYPQLRFVSLVEHGTHVLFATALDRDGVGETTLAARVLPALRPTMLCLADRSFFGWGLWTQAQATGAALVWRMKNTLQLPVQTCHADGSYQSVICLAPRSPPPHTGARRARD